MNVDMQKSLKGNCDSNSQFSPVFCIGNINENYVEEYTEKVVNAQNHQLDPIKQDLAVWINNILGIHYLSGENLLQELDNGAILCHLASTIARRAKIAVVGGYSNKETIPKIREKYFENAMRQSFFSRDNMENFIKFCRSLGVHQNLLFESDDLVLHNNWRNVVLCLLEVARLSTYYGIEPPNLVQFEKEFTDEAHLSPFAYQTNSRISWQFRSLPPSFDYEKPKLHRRKECITQLVSYKTKETEEQYQSLPISYSVAKSEFEWKSVKDDTYTFIDRKISNETSKSFDELDQKIVQAVNLLHSKCKCTNQRLVKLKIRKIGDGRYTIAGRNVFVRLLKDRHIMVRVGGGWDTFEHFLQKHDPCQVNNK
ncbi:hypothetical protein RI129_008147 [Pyrocoelia pectoralis]|uniref:Uncharacterized protein n=1 Tax=Pyrocoelia pectoralis TaxID=417401 RepID=A0AAN7ZJ35_9COLE